ncbi:MAG: Cyclolysin [Devosia sp.]|nr:Cyclolysin [Devosia sp.]
MAISRTSLQFVTESQSLWGPGKALNLSVDTGDSLIYDSGKITQDININAGIFGITGTGFVQFRVGLYAYAHLGSTGGFDATVNMEVDVEHDGGAEIGQKVNFDFSTWRVVSTDLTSFPFDGSPRAGLDLIAEFKAGIEDGNVWYPFGDTDFETTLVNLEMSFPIIKFDSRDLKLEISLFKDAVTITGMLPTGAATEGSGGENDLTVSSSGSGEDFLTVEADLDALLTQLLEKIPGVGSVIKAISEIVFGEHEFDINNYLSFVPANKFVLAATMLDVSAYAGIHVTEQLELDITGTDENETQPDIKIRLVSDNGTANDISDDRVYLTNLGQDIDVDAPIQMPGGPTVAESGTMTVTATYSLENTTMDHDVGIGLNASLTITALFAELRGEWVPPSLAFTLGPLLEKTFPTGGFSADLFTVYNPDPFKLAAGAFNTVTDDYEVFFTYDAPANWDVSTFENAQNAYLDYRQRLVEILNVSLADFQYLWSGPNGTQNVAALSGVSNVDLPSAVNHSRTWLANINIGVRLNEAAGSNNFVMVDPGDPPDFNDGRLRANIGTTTQLTAGGPTVFGSTKGFNLQTVTADALALLNALASTAGKTLHVEYDYIPVGDPSRTLITTNPVEYKGDEFGDLLVFFQGDNGNRPSHFDGGDEAVFEYDTFVANFLATDPNSAVNIDLFKAKTLTPAQFSTIFGETADTNDDVNLKNIEALVLRTGNADDNIVTYAFADYLETNGGRDIVHNRQDSFRDQIRLGSGDDIVISGNSGGTTNTDDIYGGTGYDIAYHSSSLGQRVDIFRNGAYVAGGGPTAAPIGADASMAQMFTVLINSAAIYTLNPLSTRVTWDDDLATGSNDDWMLIANGTNNGQTVYHASIEAIGNAGSTGNDAIVFTGGPVTNGGDGFDLLIADLHGYEDELHVGSGINIYYNTTAVRFGDALIQNFERYAIIGTSFADNLIGYGGGNFFSGEGGNDVLNAGSGNIEDILLGGAGSDTFWWYGGAGADILDGDDGLYDAGAGFDYLDIYAFIVEGIAHGLYHDFHTSVGDIGNVNGTDRGGKAFYTSADTIAQLLEAMTLSADSSQARAVSFFGTANADFMTYVNIESVNQEGVYDFDDLLIYQGGASYVGYDDENNHSEQDTFVADFSEENIGISIENYRLVGYTPQEGPFGAPVGAFDLGNGVTVQGIERVILKLGTGSDLVQGGVHDDYIAGGGGVDKLAGFGGNDIVNGDAGDDMLFWYSDGVDVYDGGADGDRLIANGSAAGGLQLALLNAGGSVIGSEAVGGQFEDYLPFLLNAVNAVSFRYASGANQVTYKNFEFVDVFGTASVNDLVLFQHGLVYVGGESANDRDTFLADLRSDTEDFIYDGLDVGTNGTVLNSTMFGDAVITGFEQMVVLLGSGNDHYVGSATSDVIDGGFGDDRLETGGSTTGFVERLFGGEGDDTLIVNSGSGNLDGGNGYDRADFSGLGSAVFLEMAVGNGPSVQPQLADYAEIDNFFDNVLSVSTTFFYSYFAISDNSLQRVSFTNVEEVKSTAAVNGTLIAGSSGGFMVGGYLGDTFISRGGNDIMVGGGSQDRYLFDGSFGSDIIAGEEQDNWETPGNAVGAEIFFTDRNKSEAVLSRQNNNLIIDFGLSNYLTIVDYFATGAVYGLDFTFNFADERGANLDSASVLIDGNVVAGGIGTLVALGGGADITNGVTIQGTGGNDNDIDNPLPIGTDFRDTYLGGDGDDLMKGSLGSDVYDGGAGIDMVSFLDLVDGVTVDLNTNSGFNGAATGDVFVGIENIAGGQGSNTFYGDRWNNTFVGGNAADGMEGRPGDDTLLGLGGDDAMRGDEGKDRIYGDTGVDTLNGNDGNDYLSGGADDDFVFGDAGNDTLDGGTGNDLLDGGSGDDTMTYGGKEDTAVAGFEDGIDSFDGGSNDAGGDTADYSRFTSAIGIDLTLTVGTVKTRNGADYLPTTGTARSISNLSNVENVTGSRYDDDLRGNGGSNGLDGGAGDDVFVGGAGADIIIGGAGSDTIDYSREGGLLAAAVNMSGDMVTSLVEDTFGDFDLLQSIENVIGTNAFGDQIIMNSDDNIVRGLGGADDLQGRAGNDTLIGGVGADIMDGGDGLDLVSYENSMVSVTVDLDAQTATGGDATGDTLINFEGARGSEVGDFLYGSDVANPDGTGGNVFDGQGGHDELFGYAGNDTLIGGAGGDDLRGGFGIDMASYRTSLIGLVVRLATPVGNTGDAAGDTFLEMEDLEGSAFNDTLGGDAGDNAIFGGEGNDLIEAREGEDSLFGGNGNDTLNGGAGVDFLDGGYNIDTVSYLGTLTQVVANLKDDGLNAGAALGDVFSRIENLTGGNAGDRLTGDDGNNRIDGGGGVDQLRGGLGNDTYVISELGDKAYEANNQGTADLVESAITYDLAGQALENLTLTGVGIINGFGNSAANILRGNGQNNRLDGKTGIDQLYGGLGNDTFVITELGDKAFEANNQGTADLVESAITYDLSGQALENLTLTGGGVINGFGNSAANILRVNGQNNRLDGKTGIDQLYGGLGNDTFVITELGDKAYEANNQGTADLVESAITYDLSGQALENLTLTGVGIINGFGNSAANILRGNGQNNRLDGKTGIDQLYGGLGNDTFVFRVKEDSGLGAARDVINDFEDFAGNDTIDLSAFAGTLTYIGQSAFSTANQVRAIQSGADVLIEINTVGTSGAESEILLKATAIGTIDAGDFIG